MPEIFLSWGFWYAVGGALVVVAAALLVTILLVARGIEKEAARALEAAREVDANTRAIWALAEARETLEEIRDRADSVRKKTRALAGAVGGEPEPRTSVPEEAGR